MEKDLSKYDNIYRALTWSRDTHGTWGGGAGPRIFSSGSDRSYVKCARINNELFILKTITDKKKYEYSKEIYLLLKNEDFLPTLKYFDDKHLILALTDVGDSLQMYKFKNTSQYNKLYKEFDKQIKNITDKLFNEYGLYHNDVYDGNICVDKNNKIRLIDFEATRKEKEPNPGPVHGRNTLVLEKEPIARAEQLRRDHSQKWCAKCGIALMTVDRSPKTCTHSKRVNYCSVACQHQHWTTTHKDTCPHPLSRSAQRAAAAMRTREKMKSTNKNSISQTLRFVKSRNTMSLNI